MQLRSLVRFLPSFIATLLALSAVGCGGDDNGTASQIQGTMKDDGYALFVAENNRQQINDVRITIRDLGDADENATYVLIFSRAAPRNVGWFRFDPSSAQRCDQEMPEQCPGIPGYGQVVDVVTVPPGAREVSLHDDRCIGCDAAPHRRNDTTYAGYWAVMRIERPNRESPFQIDVQVTELPGATQGHWGALTQLQ